MNVELHLHTDAYFSGIGDGAQTVVQAVDIASKKGATAIAITDHGNCANWTDFFNYATGGELEHTTLEKKGLSPVKPILGTEAYIKKEEFLAPEIKKEINQHLILLAKDYVGLQQISRYVSETNRCIKAKERPVGTFELLEKVFGDNGHVVCSSACIAGVISSCLLFNHRIDKEAEKIERRIKKSESLLGEEYFFAKERVEAVNLEIKKVEDEIESLKSVAEKKYTQVKKEIKAMDDEAKKLALQNALDVEMLETQNAKDKIKTLKEEVKALKSSISNDKKVLAKAKNKENTIATNLSTIEELLKNKKSNEELFDEACTVAKMYKSLFKDDFYIELQYHRIKEEAYVMPLLVKVARECDIKMIITNDVHVDTKENLKVRDYVRNCAAISQPWMKPIPGDEELYFKTEVEKRIILSEVVDESVIDEAFKNVEKIANECNVTKLSESNHYPEFKDADTKLRELAVTGKCHAWLKNGEKSIDISSKTAGIKARYGDNWNASLNERLEYELSIISKMGFSSYFLFIADVINKCKEARENATDIGPGRGSGAGSIVCYLSAITELDPIKYDLLFERFLNPARVSMPDIDTDFSKFARQYAINYITEFYGAKAVCGIMTKTKMGAKSSLTYAPKLLAKEEGLDIKVYSEKGEALRRLVGDDLNTKLSDIEEDVFKSYSGDEKAIKIFEIAKMLEGKITSFGQHAAGIISIMDGDIQDFIPCMMAEDAEGNDKMVIQGDMVVAEAQLGFIKFDFLGLKNLNVITACQQMITKTTGDVIDAYNLPLDDERVYSDIFTAMNTNFVFQFESDGMKKMLADLKPTRFEDLILAVSVYRPGPMDFIEDIIRCKNENCDSPIVERIPILKDVLAETYGYPVYQEQVMKIMTLCAGFDMGHADNVRRFMSKKKEDKLAEQRPNFIEGCVKNNIKADDAEWLFDQLMPFAKYGFNKSHAAAYSLVSYITAWLKLHYTPQYLCAALLEQGDKTMQFVSDCKTYGLEIYPVSVNKSGVNFSMENAGIRMGLSAIKGLKAEAEDIVKNRGEGYVSLNDFIERADVKISAIKASILSGACDEFVRNRETACNYAESYAQVSLKRNKIEEKLIEISSFEDEKKRNLKIAEWTKKLNATLDELNRLNPRQTFDLSDDRKRSYEAIYLGMYLSGSPLDDYDITNAKYKNLDDVTFGSSFLTIGVVNDFKETKTKNGDKMCFFKLLDKDSNLTQVVVFPKTYALIDAEIDDGMVVELKGVLEEKDGEIQIIAQEIKLMQKSHKNLLINTKSLTECAALLEILKDYQVNAGLTCTIKTIGGLRELSFKVSEDVIRHLDNFENAVV